MCVVFVLWAGLVVGYIWSVWKLRQMSRSPGAQIDRAGADEKPTTAVIATTPRSATVASLGRRSA